MNAGLITLLCVAIFVMALLRAAQSIRHTKGTERGAHPGKGYHVVEANYHSGGGGGGHSGSFTVPRDPQEYAQIFIPRKQRK